jgi:hypothetical protein
VARRPAGAGEVADPRLRPALVERSWWILEHFPTDEGWREFAEWEQAVMGGEEIVLNSTTLFRAYFTFDRERADDFVFALDRDGSRRWRLTADDRLVEVTPGALDGVLGA